MKKIKASFTGFRYCFNLNKTLLTVSFLCISLTTPAQIAKWFITFSVGREVSGPYGSVKNSLTANGYNVTSPGFIFGPVDYPYVTHGLSLSGMIGKQVNKKGSVYIMFGRAGKAEVSGYDGNNINNIEYQVFQFTAGYQISLSNSGWKIGGGPSLFVLQSGKNNHNWLENKLTDKHSAIKPGLSFMGRVPLGNEKRLLGLELFGELNIAPRATFEDLNSYNGRSESYNMSMVEALLGLSLSIRKKIKTAP